MRLSNINREEPPPDLEPETYTFSLIGLISEGHVLVLHTRLGTLSHLTINNGQPDLIVQEQFSPCEVNLLLSLLKSYPYYCPYHVLLAAHGGGHDLKPIHKILSASRSRLLNLGIEISSLFRIGYVLLPARAISPSNN